MTEFTSSPGVAERENRLVALLCLVGVPLALVLLRDERDPGVLAAFGVGAAAIAYAFYRWRDGRARVPVLRIDGDGLETVGGRRPFRVRWADVSAVRRSSYGGPHWTIREGASGWRVLRLDGFTIEQVAAIDALVRAHSAGTVAR